MNAKNSIYFCAYHGNFKLSFEFIINLKSNINEIVR